MVYPKAFFDLQFDFATRAVELGGGALETALLDYTNFYVRFGLGRDFNPEQPRWQQYLLGLRTAGDARAWTYRHYLDNAEQGTAPPMTLSVGCFSYADWGSDCVRLHFRAADADGASPLGVERAAQRRAELSALFGHLSVSKRNDVTVLGHSWLYNLDAYRRLFPPAFGESSQRLTTPYRAMPLWGQFVDHRRQLKPVPCSTFRSRLRSATTLTELGDCFPLHALSAEASASAFYAFYDIERAR